MTPSPWRRHTWWLGFAAWAGLAALQVVWHGWLAPPPSARTAMVVLALLPLTGPALAWRRPRRALLLAGMVSLLYFCHGVAEAWSTPAVRPLAWLEIVLCLWLVGALGMTAGRTRQTGP